MDYGFTDLTDSGAIKSVIYEFWKDLEIIIKSFPKFIIVNGNKDFWIENVRCII